MTEGVYLEGNSMLRRTGSFVALAASLAVCGIVQAQGVGSTQCTFTLWNNTTMTVTCSPCSGGTPQVTCARSCSDHDDRSETPNVVTGGACICCPAAPAYCQALAQHELGCPVPD